jgi:hypothetical protein
MVRSAKAKRRDAALHRKRLLDPYFRERDRALGRLRSALRRGVFDQAEFERRKRWVQEHTYGTFGEALEDHRVRLFHVVGLSGKNFEPSLVVPISVLVEGDRVRLAMADLLASRSSPQRGGEH